MELSKIERSASPTALRTAWIAWWAVTVSWAIGAIRLSAYFLSNLAYGDGDDNPIGALGTVFDLGSIAVSASTAVALFFVILLAVRTRSSALAFAIIALMVLFTVFVYVVDYMAWMVSAKGLFAFTPRMLTLDYMYLVLTLAVLIIGRFVSGYLGAGVLAAALVITAAFLVVAAQRWRSIERAVEA